jgi:murein DD-endopeptidase MepM/ murein hydrolase activator NlpD
LGTHLLTLILVVGVVWLMQSLYRQATLGWTPGAVSAAAEMTPTPALSMEQLPASLPPATEGIARAAKLHTTIPTRPRLDVIEYTVQPGDSLFGIADRFGLKPTTILWGNNDALKDTPHSLRVGQVLNILPVDGTYYEWQGTESLTGVAKFFGVEAETIVNFPGNHLDPDNIDLSSPSIVAGSWLVVPGGQRQFTSWSAPAQLVRADPSTRVWGPGVCTGISYVQVGYGTFIYPTVEHWLSGTPYRPDVGHYAVDFAGQMGNAIYASDAGTVVYAGWNDWGYGNLVVLDHGNGWETRYAHLSQINVGCGQNVGQGDVIALMGSTGNSSGPHLHFEMTHETYGRVNPLNFLPAP